MVTEEPAREARLESAVRAFGEAWAAGDVDTLRGLLSPTYTHNDAFGARHDRDSWLAYAAKRTGRTTQITFRDLHTRYLGDVAIITGYNDMTGLGMLSAADTRPFSLIFTQIWVWRDGGWLREAFQATPVTADEVR